MSEWLVSLGLMLAGAVLALVFARRGRAGSRLAAAGAIAGCAVGFVPAIRVLLGGQIESFAAPWMQALGGEFAVAIDPLSAVFLLPLYLLGLVATIYGRGYFAGHHGTSAAREAAAGFFLNLLLASLALVVVARNALLFLVSWETMALASFFLVVHDDADAAVRRAGRTYLVATHLGTAFVIACFFLLGRQAGGLGFDAMADAAHGLPAGMASVVFLCAVAGFGTKAGLIPFHVWLPEAHPAAPSHVSALMSGVMIKTGVYGLLRVLTFLGMPVPWWGWLLVGLGLLSGIVGVLMALAQRDLKRLLAYSSVENIGIVTLGLGIALIGLADGRPVVAAAGFAGALLHVVNHALFKGLLFLGAGSVYRATGTRELDRLGGLLRRMPVTGACTLVGAAAICGLPPLNGFLGEFLVFFGAFHGALTGPPGSTALVLLLAVAGLGLIGGLSVACFTRAFGIVFLGEPRTALPHEPTESPASMRVAMAVLAAACVLVGVSGAFVLPPLVPALAQLVGVHADLLAQDLAPASLALAGVTAAALGLLGLVVVVAGWRRRLLRGREVGATVTWDCGYARPTPRMQYTAASFAQPILGVFGSLARARQRLRRPEGLFPAAGRLDSESRDLFGERVFPPLFRLVDRWLSLLRRLQHGRLQLYILYILVTLVALLLWSLRS